MQFQLFEDSLRLGRQDVTERHSPYCDLVRYKSSVTPGIELSMLVKKPAKPSYALFATHGWHQTIAPFQHMDEPNPDMPYLYVQVDMRGRAFSQGKPDANGLELMDVYDAVQAVRARYADYLIDPDVVYFEAGSGGGGNAFALAGKFPDLFAAVTALFGISDYALWYRNDSVGEFKDEMNVWVGPSPDEDEEAYRARSGITFTENLLSPLYISHGERDPRVPVEHARRYCEAALRAGKAGLVKYFELKGVGGKSHTENATREQLDQMKAESEQNRAANRRPVALAPRGELVVGGYLVTKHFKVMLADVGKVCRIQYDLASKTIDFITKPDCAASVVWL